MVAVCFRQHHSNIIIISIETFYFAWIFLSCIQRLLVEAANRVKHFAPFVFRNTIRLTLAAETATIYRNESIPSSFSISMNWIQSNDTKTESHSWKRRKKLQKKQPAKYHMKYNTFNQIGERKRECEALPSSTFLCIQNVNEFLCAYVKGTHTPKKTTTEWKTNRQILNKM